MQYIQNVYSIILGTPICLRLLPFKSAAGRSFPLEVCENVLFDWGGSLEVGVHMLTCE